EHYCSIAVEVFMSRTDTTLQAEYYDTNFEIHPGNPLPFGASLVPGGINFSIYSHNATSCTLVLFEKGQAQPLAAIPIREAFRLGSVYSISVVGLDPEQRGYGFRMDGPHDPRRGHYFNPKALLLDPYAKAVSGREIWGKPPNLDNPYQHRARIATSDFD